MPHSDQLFEKLSRLSVDQQSNVFAQIDWPEDIGDDKYWFSPSAMMLHNSGDLELSERVDLKALSKWECINSFSMNVYGELELVQRVADEMLSLKQKSAQEYLTHLIDEENKHAWFFKNFCERYAGKLYQFLNPQFSAESSSRHLKQFLVFARIVLFEEVGHYFNIANSRDELVHPFVREINKIHYQDESRHITFGRQLITDMAERLTEEEVITAGKELTKTVQLNYNNLFNPMMYKDAGMSAPLEVRNRLMKAEANQSLYQRKILGRAKKQFEHVGVSLIFPWDSTNAQ